LRHGLVEALAPMEFVGGLVTGGAVTISQVRVSLDLKQARAFVFPLGGSSAEQLIEELNRVAPRLQGPLARGAGLRYTPRLEFVLDNTFDEADKIEALLARANAKSRPE